MTSASWLYFEDHLKRGLKRVRLLLLSAPWFCCGPRLEICSWSLMRGAAWSTGAPCGSAVAFGRCLFMSTLPGTSSPSAFPLFLISSPPYRCIAEALCISPPTPPVPISISDLRCFFFLQFFIFFPSSVPEPQNVCHFSSRSFSFLSSQLNIPCRFGLISGPFFFFLILFFFLFSARCHHHLIISGLFDYILCPWLWRGCHGGAFRLILNLQLSHTHSRIHR